MSDTNNPSNNPFRLDPKDLPPINFEELQTEGGPEIVKNSDPLACASQSPATLPKIKLADVPKSQELYAFFGIRPEGVEAVFVVEVAEGIQVPLVTTNPDVLGRMMALAATTVMEHPDVTIRIAKFTSRDEVGVISGDPEVANDPAFKGKAMAVVGTDGEIRPYVQPPAAPADPEQFDDTKPTPEPDETEQGNTGAEGDTRA